MNKQFRSYTWLILGGLMLVVFGWRWNVPIAAWLAPIFLIRFVRSQKHWASALLVIPVMSIGFFFNHTGSWVPSTFLEEVVASLARSLPLAIALFADRAYSQRMKPFIASLVFPAIYVVLDWLIAFSLLGTVFSIGATQFDNAVLLQVVALTGIWGLSFLVMWMATTVNHIWEQDFNFRSAQPLSVVVPGIVILALLVGGLRLSLFEPASETVRIGGVIVGQTTDYYTEIIDLGTPVEEVQAYSDEFSILTDALFAESVRVAEFGAKIIFWSEGNAMLTPENRDAFIERAQAFAVEHDVYFMPAYITFRYGEMTADNQLVMITPEGDIAYDYTKTMSWYPTDSDGILHSIETPYGIVSSAICFDMDFPSFINQAAKQDVDIMLVPSYDWEPIKPYHTQIGLFRGVENGFSIIRQVNDGTSMAIDYQGRTLAYQDYFDTNDPLMLVDVPTAGVSTLYGLFGDWFAYLNGVFIISLVAWSVIGAMIHNDHPRRWSWRNDIQLRRSATRYGGPSKSNGKR
jgi:apolipoprotein N-acyltransferase